MPADPLLSFVPGVVRGRLLDGEAPHADVERVQAVVLAADISGFTQLVGSLRETPAGIDELSGILNDGFSRLIDAIDGAGGDTLGFAGDSLLAYWPEGPGSAAAAAWAGLDAQRRLQSADQRIRVRIGIAVGELALWTVGGVEDRWLVVASGDGAAAAASLQASAELGQVVVTDAVAEAVGSAIRTTVEHGIHRLVDVDEPPDDQAGRRPGRGDGADPVTPIEPARLRPYLPATIVARLEAGHDHFLSELRTITAVFVRVAGLGQGSGLADIQDVVTAIQASIFRYEGTLTAGADEKGITFVAAFGMPPEAHEDDADRALSAAGAVHQALAALDRSHGIGVATGRAFCGPKGNDIRREYTALSDAVNVAARLAAAAASESGRRAILCEPATVRAARGQWSFDTAVSLRIKGKTELLTAFGLQHRNARAGLTGGRMVGRQAELEQILGLVRSAPAGATGRTVAIVADPGMGKTSLLGAVAEALRAGGEHVVVGYADSLERSIPFRAWSTVFATILDVDPDDRERTRQALSGLVGPLAPLLSPVLGLEIENTAATAALTDERRLASTRTLLLELLAAATERGGRLHLLFEDAHWFDSASWGLLMEAIKLPGLAVTLTTRPEDPARARGSIASLAGADVTEIRLQPLTRVEVGELVRAQLGAEDVDDALETLLLDTCKGNPFFTLEVMKGLVQRGALDVREGRAVLAGDGALQVPDSIQAAITTRIDGLSADQQLTLKVASVVGSSFETAILARVHPTGRSLEAILGDVDALHARDLILPAETGVHTFNHALTREVAYGLMMGEQRRDLHRSVAQCYEEDEEDRDALYPILAHHWLRAENAEKAVSYLTRAAVSSLAHGMPREAVDHGVQAAALLGVELETDPAKIRAILPGELAEIERLMAGRQPADLAGLPELIDEAIGGGIGIVLQSMPSAHQSLQTELFAMMAIRNLNLTLRFGAGILAPGVYAMYSVVLRGLGADSATAFAFSELARTVDAANGGILAAVVAFVHVWFNNHWQQPLASGIPIAHAGADAGLAGPDPLYGSFNLAAATTALATSGAALDAVIAAGEANLERIGSRSATAAFHCRLEAQMAKALSGRTPDLTSLSDDQFDEADLAAMAMTSNFNQTAYYFIAKLRLAYLAGEYADARDWAERAEVLLPSFAGQPGQGELAVLAALAGLAMLPAEPAERAAALEVVRRRLAELEQWAIPCPANFEPKARLVQAEIAAADGDPVAADTAYGEAIDSARRHGFIQWAALAAERRGHGMRVSNPAAARASFVDAAAHYEAWGATRKARELESLAERDVTAV
jgi:predicted ATPase/class 3 adenylate cyclase